MTDNKWKLHTGIHSGTMISRDEGQPREFDTREEAIADYQEQHDWFKSKGYYIWFAYLTAPDGTKETLERNSYR